MNLGIPDVGQGEENAPPADTAPEVVEEVAEEEVAEPEEVVEEVVPEPSEPESVPEKEVVKTEDPREVALKRKKEKEKREREEADRKKRAEDARKKAEAEAKRKAAEEAARKKAEADAKRKAEADKLKGEIGDLFGSGSGKGNTGTPGNQGDPGGDPDASRLEGISTGSGQVGGGLGNRGILRRHTPQETSQARGKVVVSVCVDSTGKVTEAKFTQRGSTTSNSSLVSAAITSAKRWKFSAGGPDRQCGTITYNFKVQ